MIKKALSLMLTAILLVAVFCGTTVKANSINIYYSSDNYLVYSTDEESILNISEGFNTAKEEATGLRYILNNVVIDLSAAFVQNTEPTVLSLSATDITTTLQAQNGVKAYKVSGVLDDLLKTTPYGVVEITFPYESQNGEPLVTNLNSNNQLNVLYTTYNQEQKTVTVRTDYFGDFYISDAEKDDFNYGKLALSYTDNSEEYLYLYEKIEDGLAAFDEVIEFDTTTYDITASELSVAYNAVCNDHPERFEMMVDNQGNGYSTPYGYSWDEVEIYTLNPRYYITQDEYSAYMAQIDAKANELIAGIDVARIGEYEASKIIYERLCNNVSYTLNAPYCHTIYGSLVMGNAVCDGYARAYQYLLNKLGILAHTVTGYSYNPTTGVGEGHAWSLVRINGEYYYSDVTWADQTTDIYYSYLNCSLAEISKDHQFAEPGYDLPETIATKDNYYTITGYELDFDNINTETIVDIVKKQGPKIKFKINNYTGTSILNDILTKFNENNQEILRGVLDLLGFNGLRMSAGALAQEVTLNFYNETLSDFPSEIEILGDIIVGSKLTVSTKNTEYSEFLENIVWYRNGVVIENATNTSYVLTQKDIDSTISVAAFSSNYNGAVVCFATDLVSNHQLLSGSVTISGNAKTGEKLTAQLNINAQSGIKYQWYRNGGAISGAISSSYTLTGFDVGASIYCVVSANGFIGSVTSNSINNIQAAEFLRGDANGDSSITIKDITAIKRYLADWDGIAFVPEAADVNKDDSITIKDITYLKRHFADWDGYDLN